MPQYVPYISKDFVIEGSFLRLDEKDAAWEALDGRMRTAVRKAQKSGADIRKMPNTKESVAQFAEFCLNMDDVPEELTDRYHLYCAFLADKCVAAILVVEVETKLFMLCHASTPEAKAQEIPSLLIWHVAEQFMGSKFTRFDVGASYRASLQKFFSGWKTEGYPMIMRAPELKPQLMITPFDTAALGEAAGDEAASRAFLDAKANGKPWTFFPRAMYAVYTVIRMLKEEGKLNEGDDVWVTTTTEAHYVSSCVTSAIEQTAKVVREFTPKTKAIFVIHEFGFTHPKLAELRKLADERGIPLIEDCAYSWGTAGTGTTGDYVIYSLTKRFPVQFGGILVGRAFSEKELWNTYRCSDANKEHYTLRMLAPWLSTEAADRETRRKNYAYFTQVFGANRTYFPLTDASEPGAYVLRMPSEERMQIVSAFVRQFGTECGNYWQSSGIILPVHQRLLPAHLEYIAGSVLATEREWCGIADHP